MGPDEHADGAAIASATVEVDEVEVFHRRTGGSGTPVLFLHGNPTSSVDWLPFLERLETPAFAPDLPGFGRSGRPDVRLFDYEMHSYGRFVERYCEVVGIERCSLVVHDWGSVGLLAAQRRPERLRRLVAINCVPFGVGYRWHPIARAWRRRGLGELLNATTSRPVAELLLRQARPGGQPMPDGYVDSWWPQFDRGTRRAVLRLYRSADEDVLEAAGTRLRRLVAPSLVVWGQKDPYIPAVYGRRLADALPDARLVELDGAGHWPWIDRPDVIDRIVEFVS